MNSPIRLISSINVSQPLLKRQSQRTPLGVPGFRAQYVGILIRIVVVTFVSLALLPISALAGPTVSVYVTNTTDCGYTNHMAVGIISGADGTFTYNWGPVTAAAHGTASVGGWSFGSPHGWTVTMDDGGSIGGSVDDSSPAFQTFYIPVAGDGCNSVTNIPDGSAGGGGGGGTGKQPCEGDCQPCDPNDSGIPVWSVEEPYVTLWIKDEPLGYQPAAGPRVSFHLAFKQRELSGGMDTNIFSVGKKWDFSWLSYVMKDSNGTNVVVFPGGRQRSFTNSQDYLTNTRLTGDTSSGFTLAYPDGSKIVYSCIVTNAGGTFLKAFMTERWNANSQKTTFYYSSYSPTAPVIRLLYVVDGDGRTNSIYYVNGNLYSTNLISHVVDPFYRTNKLAYDNTGHLTNSIDVAGIPSSFAYDANDWVFSLTTPYGTTAFSITDTSGANVIPNGRSVDITQPDGGHQLYVYRDSAPGLPWAFPTNEVPRTDPAFANTFDNSEMLFRNTFHWGPRQYQSLSTTNVSALTSNDFRKARLRHWLKNDYFTVGQTISMERDPSPDSSGDIEGQKTWYDYPGKPNPRFIGTQHIPLFIAQVLPDGSTNYTRTDRNSLGAATTNISTYSVGATVLLRTNISSYSTDGIDLLTITNAIAVQISSNSYNAFHQVLTNFTALGEQTTYTYNSSHELTSVTRPSGLITTNIYDANGLLVMTYDYAIIGGTPVYYRTNSYTYTNNLIYTHTDERGLTTTNIYDNLQRLINSSDSRGAIKYIYTNLSLIQVIDRLGFTNSFGYDQLERKIAETNAMGYFKLYSYCTCGSLDTVRDSSGNYTQFYYDNQGRLTNTIYPDGFSVIQNLDLLGRITNATDSAGTSVTNWFNNQGLSIAVSNAFGRVQATIYDALDRITNSTPVNSVAVSTTYDNLNRPISKFYPDGGVEKFGYSFNVSQMISHTNQIGNITWFSYDPLSRETAETNGNLEITQFSYTPGGELSTLTDAKNQTTSWNYDEFGRITNKVNAANDIVFAYKYDSNGHLTNRWTPAKGSTTYIYDPLGRLTNVVYPSSPQISIAYDVLNRVTNMIDGLGTTHYSYDTIGQLLSEDGPWANDTVSYSYSNRLRIGLSVLQPNASPWVQSYGYDLAKRLTNIASSAGVFSYYYDANRPMEIQKLLLPNGAAITNSYDSVARLLSTTLRNNGGTLLNSHSYALDSANERTQQVFTAGNFVNYTYDPVGQLKTVRGIEPTGTTNRWNEQLSYVYDAAGNLNWRTNNSLVQNFGVNNLNELNTNTRSGTLTVVGTTTSSATNVTVNTSNAFLYVDSTFASTNHTLADGNNNFTAIAKDAYGRIDTNSVTANLPATNIFVYDPNGNLITNGNRFFEYDDENQLVRITQPNSWKSEFAYDGKMRRRALREYAWNSGAWLQTNEVHYVYCGNLKIQERDGNNLPRLTFTRGLDLSGSFEGGGGIGSLLARTDMKSAIDQPAASVYYHADGNGNVTCLINNNQTIVARYVYDPFGNTISLSGSLADENLYRFSSKEIHSNSGLYYFGYRFYDPNLQRWLNCDPIAEEPNLYCFVANNPLTRVDPLGLYSFDMEVKVYIEGSRVSFGGRTFNAGTKADHVVHVDTDTESITQSKFIGTTIEYGADGNEIRRGRAPSTGLTASISCRLIKTTAGCCKECHIEMSGSAADPLFHGFAPALDYDFFVSITLCLQSAYFFYSGSHDAYPSYEFYLAGQKVHSWSHTKEGTSPLSLYSWVPVYFHGDEWLMTHL